MSLQHRLVALCESVRTGDDAENALTVAFVLGIIASVVHWSGLLVSGVLLGLVASSVWRALLTGLYLGGAVILLFALSLFVSGVLTAYLSMGVVLLASVGVGVGLPMLAAGATRGLT